MPELLKRYIEGMKKAKTVAAFDEIDRRYNEEYNALLSNKDFDSSSFDMGYMDALRQRSFLVRKARRENKKD